MALDRYDLSKSDKGWRLMKSGATRASVAAPTKAEAVKKMQDFMAKREGTVRIHKEDGKIQEERTYPRSADPKRRKG